MPRKQASKTTRGKHNKTKSEHITSNKKHKTGKQSGMMSSSSNRLENLLNTISNNRSAMTKSEINLPARLMQHSNISSSSTKPVIYSKSISSSFSSTMHNGEVHRTGKEVIDDSSKPFIQVSELHNNHLDQYMIPRNQHIGKHMEHNKIKKTKKTKRTQKTSKISKK